MILSVSTKFQIPSRSNSIFFFHFSSSLSDLSDLKIKSSMAEEKFKNIDATMIESLKVSNGTAQLVETLRKDYLVPISNLKSIQNK